MIRRPVRCLAPPPHRGRLPPTVAIKLRQPRCSHCSKALLWQMPPRTPARPRLSRRSWRRIAAACRALERKLAVRCLDCTRIFCPSCARRHFAPVRRAERVVEIALERMAAMVMEELTKLAGSLCDPAALKRAKAAMARR